MYVLGIVGTNHLLQIVSKKTWETKASQTSKYKNMWKTVILSTIFKFVLLNFRYLHEQMNGLTKS